MDIVLQPGDMLTVTHGHTERNTKSNGPVVLLVHLEDTLAVLGNDAEAVCCLVFVSV